MKKLSKRKTPNKSEWIRNTLLNAARSQSVGWTMETREFIRLFKSIYLVETIPERELGHPSKEFSFKAVRIVGNVFWFDQKQYAAYTKRIKGKTYDRFEIGPPEPKSQTPAQP